MIQVQFNSRDLYSLAGLQKIDDRFMAFLKGQDPALHQQLIEARHSPPGLPDQSTLMIALAPFIETFIGQAFDIQQEISTLQAANRTLIQLADFKRQYIQKRIIHKFKDYNWQGYTAESFQQYIHLSNTDLLRHLFTAQAESNVEQVSQLELYIAWRCSSTEGQQLPYNMLFDLPKKTDYSQLFPFDQQGHLIKASPQEKTYRDGFNLTDHGPDALHAADHAHYCLKCHKTNKDSCAHGLKDKAGAPQTNPLQNRLHGCPLEQRISEMNVVQEQGFSLGALAIITLDNPMVAATGYRICNDCEKACIFQKQTPVDVPSIETHILKNVLTLPWGFEIYSLLTRWNPLNFAQPLPKLPTPYTVLVAGMGPSGFTLAHYLLRQGHHVLGIDGLKIEPLPPELTGRQNDGTPHPFKPIKDIAGILEPLSERPAYGFGGVAEYGITVRWDKNYLKIIRLLLERHTSFRLLGHTRFGGTLTLQKAYQLGFDHVVLCLGAGKPNFLQLDNGYVKGIRAASDFLMALQLTGAARQQSLTNLQIRLPLVVIGGGLTAIDTATEALAYYPVQVEKFWHRYQLLCTAHGREHVEKYWTEEDRQIAQEFMTHAQAIQQERHQAEQEKRPPQIATLITKWGSVTVLYRKHLQDSPAYRLNAHEVQQALLQGVQFLEQTVPLAVNVDPFNAIQSLEVLEGGQAKTLDVKTLFYATGTEANTHYAHEHPQELSMKSTAFQSQNGQRPFLHNSIGQNYVSTYGDLDPEYAGSVVKAMASAKKGYPLIDHALFQRPPLAADPQQLLDDTTKLLQPRLIAKVPLTAELTQFTIEAPLAAEAYQPGHFFRLQSFGSSAKAVAVTPINVDAAQGHLTFVMSHAGPSSSLIQQMQIGTPVALMGPTGCPSAIPAGQQILIVAQGFYALLQLPVIRAMQAAGSKVYLYLPQGHGQPLLAPFKDGLKDLVIFENEETLIEVLLCIDHLLIMGNEEQMRAFRNDLQTKYQPLLKPTCEMVASINSPMQCMMKEICAQCIQLHKDPDTGEQRIIYSCATQDQPLKSLNFDMLKGRLNQNSLLEKISRLWGAYTNSQI
jgi:NADPH-dependent glutamate synthase beta subunit-like oxidoreductase